MTACHIRDVCVRLEALRYDPRLLLRRPSSPALPPRNHLDALISATFVPGIIPGIKHGSYHRAVSQNQRMTSNIAGNPGAREVGRSNPLRSISVWSTGPSPLNSAVGLLRPARWAGLIMERLGQTTHLTLHARAGRARDQGQCGLAIPVGTAVKKNTVRPAGPVPCNAGWEPPLLA